MWKFSWCSLYELHNSKARIILIVIRFNRVYLDQSSCWNLMKKGRNLNISHCSESDCCNIEWVGDEVHNIPPEKRIIHGLKISVLAFYEISQIQFSSLLTYHWCIPLVLHPRAAWSLTKWVLKREDITLSSLAITKMVMLDLQPKPECKTPLDLVPPRAEKKFFHKELDFRIETCNRQECGDFILVALPLFACISYSVLSP